MDGESHLTRHPANVAEPHLPVTEPDPVQSERRVAEQLYLDHAFLLRRIVVRKFGIAEEEAETIVHDVFVEYLVRPRDVHHNVRSYLIAAVCNASRNYWRAQRTRDRYFPPEPGGTECETVAAGDDLFEGLSHRLVVGATLARLGARCREILRRYYLEEEDSASIAVALDTTPSNVHYLMHVCRKKARQIYETIAGVR